MTYAQALGKFGKAEKALQCALNRLEAARNGYIPADITVTRTQAKAFERVAAEAWEAVEELRRLHWEERAKESYQALEEFTLPFLEEVIQARRNSGRTGLTTNPQQILSHIATLPRAAVQMEIRGVPAEPLTSSALDQAEEDV